MSGEALWSHTHLGDGWWEALFMPFQRDSLVERGRGSKRSKAWRDGMMVWWERENEEMSKGQGELSKANLLSLLPLYMWTDYYRALYWQTYRPRQRCLFLYAQWDAPLTPVSMLEWNVILYMCTQKQQCYRILIRPSTANAANAPQSCMYLYLTRSLEAT